MTKRDRSRRKAQIEKQPAATSPDGRRGGSRPSAPRGGPRRPILRFVVIFGLCMAGFYALTSRWSVADRAWLAYLDFNAEVSGSILSLLGQDVKVVGRSINSPRGSLLIEEGCDAIYPSALFVSAVIASPVMWWTKLLGAVVGTLFLMITNLVRIISLFFIQIHYPKAFEIMHVEVWQAVFIFLALLCWILWAAWAVRRRGTPDRAAD